MMNKYTLPPRMRAARARMAGVPHAGVTSSTQMLMAGIVAAMAVCSCAPREKGPAARPPVAVQTAVAFATNAPIIISAFGIAQDCANVDVVPQISGMLVKDFIEDGALVTNGQVLFLIDAAEYAAKVRQIKSSVAADKAQVALCRLLVERNKKLFDEKLVSPEVYDTVKTRLEAAEAQQSVDESLLDQAQINFERCTVNAPLTGICSKCYVDVGNLVEANKTKLTNIRSYDPMRVDVAVPEDRMPLVRLARDAGAVRVDVTPRGTTNMCSGFLTFMDNAVDSDSGTILLRCMIPNPRKILWARQFVDVRIVAGVVSNAVVVPESAVQLGKRGPYLFVVDAAGLTDLRLVGTGVRCGGLIQISTGVMAGERVVVLGQLMLYPGAPVTNVALATAVGPPAVPARTNDHKAVQ